ncbi:MAG: Xaa-Pro peptidase family protein [Acidimicrobiia bacterium]
MDHTAFRGIFTAEEYADRLRRVRRLMEAHPDRPDALLITSPENIYYLIGLSHQGYFAFTMFILPLDGPPALLTRSMERHTISQQAPDIEHIGYGDEEEAGTAAVAAIKGMGMDTAAIGVDRSSMFFPAGVWEDLKQGVSGVRWIDTSRSASTDPRFRAGLVDETRLIKSPAELDYIRKAAAISDRATRSGLAAAGVGGNEKEVAAEIYRAMILGGGEYPGFAPLVRSSETLMQEHATWRDRHLQPGEKLFIELSGSINRYHAPLGRMGYISRIEPGAERVQRIATDALEAAVGALKPGVQTGTVYESWQSVVDSGLGHDRLRRHHCGYTVGIGFPPSWVGSSSVLGIRPNGLVEVKEGMAFHILSWVTDEDLGDYFLSDTLIVGSGGGEVITTAPRRLLIE